MSKDIEFHIHIEFDNHNANAKT